MGSNKAVSTLGIRCSKDSVTLLVLLAADGKLGLADHRNIILTHRSQTPDFALRKCAEAVGDLLGTHHVDLVGLATFSSGVRFRRTSHVRLHLEGAALLAAVNAGVGSVSVATSHEIRKHVPLVRSGCRLAMRAICERMGLESGRNKDITRDPYTVEAFGAAATVLVGRGHPLPPWLLSTIDTDTMLEVGK